MRRVLTILALLLAGAVANVAVAWGCAAKADGGSSFESKSEWGRLRVLLFGRSGQ